MTVTVKVLRGNGWPNKETIGKSDPYCKISLGGQTLRTKTKDNTGSQAEWNETLTFLNVGSGQMEITVMDSDTFKDEVLATGTYDISRLPAGNNLAKINLTPSGILELVVTNELSNAYNSGQSGSQALSSYANSAYGGLAGASHSGAQALSSYGNALMGDYSSGSSGFNVLCIDGGGWKDEDWIGKADPYCKITVNGETHQTRTHDEGGTKAQWNQKLAFKCSAVGKLDVVVMDSDVGKADDLLGRGSIDLSLCPPDETITVQLHPNGWVRLVVSYSGGAPTSPTNYNIPGPSSSSYSAPGASSSSPQAKRNVTPTQGGFAVTCIEGSGWDNADSFGKCDPYCKITVNGETQKTRVHERGGTSAKWNQTLAFKSLPTGKLEVVVMDEDDFKSDDFLGRGFVDLSTAAIGQPITVPLQPKGFIRLSISYTGSAAGPSRPPATSGSSTTSSSSSNALQVTCVEGAGWKNADFIGKSDPYVSINIGRETLKTKAINGGGTSAKWNETLTFNSPLQGRMTVTVLDDDIMKDDILGKAIVDLSKCSPGVPFNQPLEPRGWIRLIVNGGGAATKPPASRALPPTQPPVIPPIGKKNAPVPVSLDVQCIGGNGWRERDGSDVADPYCVVSIQGDTKRTQNVENAGSQVRWNETLHFQIIPYGRIEVSVIDRNYRGQKDSMLGSGSVDFSQIFPGVPFVVPLSPKGSVNMIVSFARSHQPSGSGYGWKNNQDSVNRSLDTSGYGSASVTRNSQSPGRGLGRAGETTIICLNGGGWRNHFGGALACALKLGNQRKVTRAHKGHGDSQAEWNQPFTFTAPPRGFIEISVLSEEANGQIIDRGQFACEDFKPNVPTLVRLSDGWVRLELSTDAQSGQSGSPRYNQYDNPYGHEAFPSYGGPNSRSLGGGDYDRSVNRPHTPSRIHSSSHNTPPHHSPNSVLSNFPTGPSKYSSYSPTTYTVPHSSHYGFADPYTSSYTIPPSSYTSYPSSTYSTPAYYSDPALSSYSHDGYYPTYFDTPTTSYVDNGYVLPARRLSSPEYISPLSSTLAPVDYQGSSYPVISSAWASPRSYEVASAPLQTSAYPTTYGQPLGSYYPDY